MPYTKTELKKYHKENIINLYITDQSQYLQDKASFQEENKQLLIDKAQAENNLKLLKETFDVSVKEETAKITVENYKLQKENQELKSQIDSNSPNNTTLIKNLTNANSSLHAHKDELLSQLQKLTDEMEESLPGLAQYCEGVWWLDAGILQGISKQKEQLEKAQEDHIHFNTIWKTEGITEQDIIDMKRQITNQCEMIKTFKEEHKQRSEIKEKRSQLISDLFDLESSFQ